MKKVLAFTIILVGTYLLAQVEPPLPTSSCASNYYSWAFNFNSGPQDADHNGSGMIDANWTLDSNNLPIRLTAPTATGTLSMMTNHQVPELTVRDNNPGGAPFSGETHLIITRQDLPPGAHTIFVRDQASAEHTVFAVKDSGGNLLNRFPSGSAEYSTGTITRQLNITVPADGIIYIYTWISDFDLSMNTSFPICEDFSDAPLSYGIANHPVVEATNANANGVPYSPLFKILG